ncbi:MAG: hypothetical protein IJ086_11550 [Clostridium sp.]|nr:hypothetical protein [Clostridium sp.]
MNNLNNEKFTNLSNNKPIELVTINYNKTSSNNNDKNQTNPVSTLFYAGLFCFICAPFLSTNMSNLLTFTGATTTIGTLFYLVKK